MTCLLSEVSGCITQLYLQHGHKSQTIVFQSDFNINTQLSKLSWFKTFFLNFSSRSHLLGHHYLSKIDDKYHAGTIESAFKGLHDDIDAAFSHKDHIHIIKVSAN